MECRIADRPATCPHTLCSGGALENYTALSEEAGCLRGSLQQSAADAAAMGLTEETLEQLLRVNEPSDKS